MPLSREQVERYSRQLLVPGFGIGGQRRLCDSSVLIVGAGGLGCPAGLYLAGAGVGRIGFVDYDSVEQTNLHRQVLHYEDRVGAGKAESACQTLRALNSTIALVAHSVKLAAGNAVELAMQYDLVLDASDNAVTRYIANDACIKAGKPLVSGAALRWEGQLTTYNHAGGPCYRCLYPEPPPPAAVTNCDAGGVIGAVTGVIGSLQALEAIRILSGQPANYSGRLLVFDGAGGRLRTVQLRPRRAGCACAGAGSFELAADYEEFCGASATDKTPSGLPAIAPQDRMACADFAAMSERPLLVDVRPPIQYEICSIPGSVNIPLGELSERVGEIRELLGQDPSRLIVAVCRRGNQSQQAVLMLRQLGFPNVRDIVGGMRSWSLEVDDRVPIY